MPIRGKKVEGRSNFLVSGVSSLWNKLTGSGLTAAQQQQQNYETEMSNTAYQRQVADMKAAGLNPAVMYGGSPGAGASVPSGPDVSGNGDVGSVLQLMLMGKQAKLLDAQANQANSQAGLTDRNAAWVDKLNQSTLDLNMRQMGLLEGQVNALEYDNALKAAQTLQIGKETAWIDRINEAKTKEAAAAAARNFAEAEISRMEKQLGHRLGSSELLTFVDALAAGINNPNNSTRKALDTVIGYVKTLVHPEFPQSSASLFRRRSRRTNKGYQVVTHGGGSR